MEKFFWIKSKDNLIFVGGVAIFALGVMIGERLMKDELAKMQTTSNRWVHIVNTVEEQRDDWKRKYEELLSKFSKISY